MTPVTIHKNLHGTSLEYNSERCTWITVAFRSGYSSLGHRTLMLSPTETIAVSSIDAINPANSETSIAIKCPFDCGEAIKCQVKT